VDYILITTFYIVVCYFLSCTCGKFFCRMFRDELERQGVPNIKKTFGKDFRLGSGTMLVFIGSDFSVFLVPHFVQILIYVCFMW
jgi:hypothetical protein